MFLTSSQVVVVTTSILLFASSPAYAKSKSSNSSSSTSPKLLLPEKQTVAEKRSIHALLNHLTDLQSLSQLQNNLPSSLGAISSTSTSGFDDYTDNNNNNNNNNNDGSLNYDTNFYNYDDKSSDGISGTKSTTFSSPKNRFNQQKRPEHASSSPYAQLPPPPIDVLRTGYHPDFEKDNNNKYLSNNHNDGVGYQDDDRDELGYFDNSYYPTDDKKNTPSLSDGIPFYPSHGPLAPQQQQQQHHRFRPHPRPHHNNQPLPSPQEYRLPLYSSGSSGGSGRGGRNGNAIPYSNQKLGGSELGHINNNNNHNLVDPSSPRYRHHHHHHNYQQQLQYDYDGEKPSLSKSPPPPLRSNGGGSGTGGITSSTFPYGLPLPPIPPGFGGYNDDNSPQQNPDTTTTPRGNSPQHRERAYPSLSYGGNLDHPIYHHSGIDHYPHASSPTTQHGPSPPPPSNHDDNGDNDSIGYGGLAERHPPASSPRPPTTTTSQIDPYHSTTQKFNEFGYPTSGLGSFSDYQNQIALTNALQVLQASSSPPYNPNNYPLLNNALNGLSSPSTSYDGLAGYGLLGSPTTTSGGDSTSTAFGTGLFF